jgi:hypothetical protein
MQAPLSLRKPNNWQDFENLCKKLWGEIWRCPEIKKNGRNGQGQHGVDIYGIPENESQYFGIQCKGKSEYYGKPFTEEEITAEIQNAKSFQPALKKLYFATTAVKDSVIESFVRVKNIENKQLGLFEVHLFSWEDIVELVDENKQTHDWYVKSQNYKANKNVLVTFDDDKDEITLNPVFQKLYIDYKMRIIPSPGYDDAFFGFTDFASQERPVLTTRIPGSGGDKINLSFAKFRLKLRNTGLDSIDDFKILFSVEGNIQLANHNFHQRANSKVINTDTSNVSINEDLISGQIAPARKTLVGDDNFISDEIYIKPNSTDGNCKIYWKLISKDFKNEGTLLVSIVPEIKSEYQTVLISDPLKVRSETREMADLNCQSKISKTPSEYL